MKIKILTLFPEMLAPMLEGSILGRAVRAGHISIELINIRDYSLDKHKNTDDYPFGGGAGMVMSAQPIVDAIEANQEAGMRRIYLSPRGRTLNQRIVEEYARCNSLLFLCGHYEGVDQRALDLCIDEELSIGDYVLTGGELGALVAVDAVARLIPGVLGCDESNMDESFSTGLLEYPQYTRPADFRGMKVPQVLLGGVHADIDRWRRQEALEITRNRRPDLLKTAPLNEGDREILQKLDKADSILAELRTRGVKAERLDLFEEAAYAREWLQHFVPADRLKSAKRHCLSSKKHVGFLYQAFEHGHVTDCEEDDFSPIVGCGVLYLDRYGLAFCIENCECVGELPPCALLTDVDFSRTIAISNKNRRYLGRSVADSGAI